MKINIYMSSLPRSGSTYMCRSIGNKGQGEYLPHDLLDNGLIKNHRPPPEYIPEGYKAVYLFGNPYEAVISTKLKRFGTKHFLNCGYAGRAQNIYEKDFLGYENTFDRWMAGKYDFPTMLIRYETMHEHFGEINDFLGMNINWLRWKDRKTNLLRVNHRQRVLIGKTYGSLYNKIKKAPDIVILNN